MRIEIPEGYEVINNDVTRPGDKLYDPVYCEWHELKIEHKGDVYTDVFKYHCVIRKIKIQQSLFSQT